MIRLLYKILITSCLLIISNQILALSPAEIGRDNGRLEIEDIRINGVGPAGDGIGDDSPFFSKALHLYKDYYIQGNRSAGYIVLGEGKKYRITKSIYIGEQRGLTIQGRGEGENRSTILIDFSEETKGDNGIIVSYSYFVNLRKLRITSTSNHIGNAVYLKNTFKTEIHDVDFIDVYNGVRHATANGLTLSKIKMINPRGLYGVFGIGLADHGDCCVDIIGFQGVSTSNNNLEWIKWGQYAATLIMYDIDLYGGNKGIVMDNVINTNNDLPKLAPKFIVGQDILISSTLNESIHIRSGYDIQMSRVTIDDSGADGIRIEPEFNGGFLLSEPKITGSGKNGIYIGNGHQVHIYDPVIGYNSTNSPNQYSGIYVAIGTEGYSINYGVIGDFNQTNNNQQKYGIEIAGTKGLDSNYFSIVDVQDIGNNTTQTPSSDPNGNWFFRVRPNRITTIPLNSPIVDVSSLTSIAKDYPENVIFVDAGNDHIQPAIDSICASGGVLWLKPGRHLVSSDLTIANCNNLRIVQASNHDFSDVFLHNNSNDKVKINISNSTNITFNDVYIKSYIGHDSTAMNIIGSTNVIMANSNFVNTNSGINIMSSINTKIIMTYFTDVHDKAIVVSGTKSDTTSNTIIYNAIYNDQSEAEGYGTGTAFIIKSHTDNTQIIEGIGLSSGKTLIIKGDLDENGKLIHPTNIKGYQVVSDHNSKEGILINAGKNIEFTNLWMGSNIDYKCEPWPHDPSGTYTGCVPSSHVRINDGENIKIFNSLIQGAGGHGAHVVGGKNISIINTISGRHGKYSPSGYCDYDGIRVEAPVDGLTLRGGTSGNLFDDLYGSASWPHQRRGLTLLSQKSSLVKGFDFHDNCFNPPSYGAPWVQQYNPGW